jgi:tRNA nucleotidyltransferase (CCA-adding enzyme)
MPDFIYLLENRLSSDQRHALRVLRDVATEAGMILFLTGDAVRDLTSGHAVRELEVAVHGDALKLKKVIGKSGGSIWGEDEASKTLYLCFPGTVRVDLVSTHRVEYPKPGKPVYHPASIQEDLRRRDFTANAMAISLNEGSFGLLMDPLNGAADIETRTLRLVSNYGFLEEPALLIRATRYRTRLSWELDPRTQTRYENAKAEGVIESLSAHARGAELEQIGHEEDGLKVLEALEVEGWMKALYPPWTPAKADIEGLKALHELAVELQMQGVHPDLSAAQMELLTAKLAPKDLSALKKLMIRPGFVEEWNSLDSLAGGFAKVLMAKTNQGPSTTFKLFTSYDPEAILWLGFTTKDSAVRERYNLFLKVWPEARQRIPYALMQEMRITPELPTYHQVVEAVFLELIDGRLTTPEEARAFLEPHSPPAPPPQVTIKRPRAKRGAEPKFKEAVDEEEEEEGLEEEELDEIGGDDEEMDLGIPIPKGALEADLAEEGEADADDEEAETEDDADEDSEPAPPASKRASKAAAAQKPAKEASPPAAAKSLKPPVAPKSAPPQPAAPKPQPVAQAKPTPNVANAGKPKPAPEPAKTKPAPSSKPPSKPEPVEAKASKTAAAKPAKKEPPAKAPVKAPQKNAAPAKSQSKAPSKAPAGKAAPPKPNVSKNGKSQKATKPAKPAAKKPAPKSGKKH